MKVLFAVNNENISESIIKKYQQEYKEIISVKNVYYFNAIVKELQRDKTYDRIVISEDLQPFSNNNYDTIDKFIFEKMDNISDEATNLSGNDIPIILICTDRRTKSEPLLVKLFGIGVYNALIGKDRSITNVCELLARPRTKKEAKVYYRIDSEDVDYKVESEGDVSEGEIQNILNYYKKLGRNEEEYVASFDHIASQYTDSQLRLIAKFLPLNVKAVLEANSPKYQEIVSFGSTTKSASKENKYNDYSKNVKVPKNKTKFEKFETENKSKKQEPTLDIIDSNLSRNKITEPVIIPSAINKSRVKKVQSMDDILDEIPSTNQAVNSSMPEPAMEKIPEIDSATENRQIPETEETPAPLFNDLLEEEPETMAEQEKIASQLPVAEQEEVTAQPKRRGRPRKIQPENATNLAEPKVKKGRGRPKKVQPVEPTTMATEEQQEELEPQMTPTTPLNLFELGEEEETPHTNTTNISNPQSDDMMLPGLDDEDLFAEEASQEDPILMNNQMPQTNIRQSSQKPQETSLSQSNPFNANQNYQPYQPSAQRAVENTQNNYSMDTDLSRLLTRDKKVVAFVGTSKNGTSFLVNNLAEMLSQKGINTAILDLTQNRNAYYIYTENEENLRKVAYDCIDNLRRGNANGIQVHKNLTVYTTLPGENEDINDYANILQTLIQNYSLVILDCDFETNYGYFKEAQELYLVQSLDVLTIQPLTAFLRNLKAKNALNPEKIRIALNKVVKLRSVTEKTIIGGMAYYNDPAMSFMTELFNKDTVPYCSIPFEEQTYSKYLEGLINCKITLNGYSKNFMAVLTKLADMVYPLIGNNASQKNTYNNYYTNTQNNFSSTMNNTLNKMKNNY